MYSRVQCIFSITKTESIVPWTKHNTWHHISIDTFIDLTQWKLPQMLK